MQPIIHQTPRGRVIGFNYDDLFAAVDRYESAMDRRTITLPDTAFRVLDDDETPPVVPATDAAFLAGAA